MVATSTHVESRLNGGALDSANFQAYVLVRAALWFAAAFLFVATLSGAPGFEFFVVLKYLRPALLVATIVSLILARGWIEFGPTALGMAVFVVFYWIAGLWSPYPVAATLYKGNFLASVLAGFLLAQSIGRGISLESSLRILLFGAGSLVLTAIALLAQGQVAYVHNRLTVFDMNPNRMAEAAAWAGLIAACFLSLRPAGHWRTLGWAIFVVAILVVIMTGSRTAFGAAAIGVTVVWLWHSRDIFTLIGRIGLCVAGLVVAGGMVELMTLDRFRSFDLTNREWIWNHALEQFFAAPIAGQGWWTVPGTGPLGVASTGNLHSIYLQILAETGIMGAILFVIGCLCVAWGVLQPRIIGGTEGRSCIAVGIGLFAAVLAYGFTESAPLTGATGATFLFGLGVGLIDRTYPNPWRYTIFRRTVGTREIRPGNPRVQLSSPAPIRMPPHRRAV